MLLWSLLLLQLIFILHLDWGVDQQPAGPPGPVQQQLFRGEFSQLRSRKSTHEAKGGQQVSGQRQEGPAQMGAVHSSQVCHFILTCLQIWVKMFSAVHTVPSTVDKLPVFCFFSSDIMESRWRISVPAGATALRSSRWCTPSGRTWWTWRRCGGGATGRIWRKPSHLQKMSLGFPACWMQKVPSIFPLNIPLW